MGLFNEIKTSISSAKENIEGGWERATGKAMNELRVKLLSPTTPDQFNHDYLNACIDILKLDKSDPSSNVGLLNYLNNPELKKGIKDVQNTTFDSNIFALKKLVVAAILQNSHNDHESADLTPANIKEVHNQIFSRIKRYKHPPGANDEHMEILQIVEADDDLKKKLRDNNVLLAKVLDKNFLQSAAEGIAFSHTSTLVEKYYATPNEKEKIQIEMEINRRFGQNPHLTIALLQIYYKATTSGNQATGTRFILGIPKHKGADDDTVYAGALKTTNLGEYLGTISGYITSEIQTKFTRELGHIGQCDFRKYSKGLDKSLRAMYSNLSDASILLLNAMLQKIMEEIKSGNVNLAISFGINGKDSILSRPYLATTVVELLEKEGDKDAERELLARGFDQQKILDLRNISRYFNQFLKGREIVKGFDTTLFDQKRKLIEVDSFNQYLASEFLEIHREQLNALVNKMKTPKGVDYRRLTSKDLEFLKMDGEEEDQEKLRASIRFMIKDREFSLKDILDQIVGSNDKEAILCRMYWDTPILALYHEYEENPGDQEIKNELALRGISEDGLKTKKELLDNAIDLMALCNNIRPTPSDMPKEDDFETIEKKLIEDSRLKELIGDLVEILSKEIKERVIGTNTLASIPVWTLFRPISRLFPNIPEDRVQNLERIMAGVFSDPEIQKGFKDKDVAKVVKLIFGVKKGDNDSVAGLISAREDYLDRPNYSVESGAIDFLLIYEQDVDSASKILSPYILTLDGSENMTAEMIKGEAIHLFGIIRLLSLLYRINAQKIGDFIFKLGHVPTLVEVQGFIKQYGKSVIKALSNAPASSVIAGEINWITTKLFDLKDETDFAPFLMLFANLNASSVDQLESSHFEIYKVLKSLRDSGIVGKYEFDNKELQGALKSKLQVEDAFMVGEILNDTEISSGVFTGFEKKEDTVQFDEKGYSRDLAAKLREQDGISRYRLSSLQNITAQITNELKRLGAYSDILIALNSAKSEEQRLVIKDTVARVLVNSNIFKSSPSIKRLAGLLGITDVNQQNLIIARSIVEYMDIRAGQALTYHNVQYNNTHPLYSHLKSEMVIEGSSEIVLTPESVIEVTKIYKREQVKQAVLESVKDFQIGANTRVSVESFVKQFFGDAYLDKKTLETETDNIMVYFNNNFSTTIIGGRDKKEVIKEQLAVIEQLMNECVYFLPKSHSQLKDVGSTMQNRQESQVGYGKNLSKNLDTLYQEAGRNLKSGAKGEGIAIDSTREKQNAENLHTSISKEIETKAKVVADSGILYDKPGIAKKTDNKDMRAIIEDNQVWRFFEDSVQDHKDKRNKLIALIQILNESNKFGYVSDQGILKVLIVKFVLQDTGKSKVDIDTDEFNTYRDLLTAGKGNATISSPDVFNRKWHEYVLTYTKNQAKVLLEDTDKYNKLATRVRDLERRLAQPERPGRFSRNSRQKRLVLERELNAARAELPKVLTERIDKGIDEELKNSAKVRIEAKKLKVEIEEIRKKSEEYVKIHKRINRRLSSPDQFISKSESMSALLEDFNSTLDGDIGAEDLVRIYGDYLEAYKELLGLLKRADVGIQNSTQSGVSKKDKEGADKRIKELDLELARYGQKRAA